MIAFCCARLVRPLVVQAAYAGGPHEEDGAASIANTFVWLAVICGILGAIAVSNPWRSWLKVQGASPKLTWNMEPTALGFLASAVFLDALHQTLACA